MRSFLLRGVGPALLGAAVSIGALAAPAQAAGTGKAYVQEGGKVWYKAATGKTNKVVITLSGNTVTIDDRVAIKAGAGCKRVKGDKTKVRCTAKVTLDSVRVYLRDRNDTLVNKSKLTLAGDGGSGNDTITGGPGDDTLWGGAGKDVLRGLGGDDFLFGDVSNVDATGGDTRVEGANDRLYGGAGDDYLEGNVGADKIYGDGGKDIVYGSNGADAIYGGSGDDDVNGLGGADEVYGGAGKDTLRGGRGNDQLHGQTGNDTLLGQRGNDAMYGGPGDDELSGDDVDASGNPDKLDGGVNGTAGDACVVLSGDTAVHCER